MKLYFMVSPTLYIWFQTYETVNGGETMNKNTATITAIALGIVAVSGTVFAYGGGFDIENRGAKINTKRIIKREAVMSAIESGDFEAWKAAITETLTEENFNRIREMQQNREERMNEMHENMESIIQALEDEDYEAWKIAIEESGRTEMLDVIDEENFEILVQIHEAEISGDFETARELSQELGIGCEMFGGFRGRMEGRMGPMPPLEGD